MNLLKVMALAIICTFAFSGCSDDDDPVAETTDDITAQIIGDWQMISIKIDGVEMYDQLLAGYGEEYVKAVYTFTKDGDLTGSLNFGDGSAGKFIIKGSIVDIDPGLGFLHAYAYTCKFLDKEKVQLSYVSPNESVNRMIVLERKKE